MKLYHVSPHRDIGDMLTQPCSRVVCEHKGFSPDHVCFSTIPLMGRGEWVHTLDVPSDQVSEYRYQDVFRSQGVDSYALPLEMIWDLANRGEIEVANYETVTGREWNRWDVLLQDNQDTLHTYHGLLWVSRPGMAGATVISQSDVPGQEYLNVEVTTSEEFDPDEDYIILEKHWSREGRYGEALTTWELELIAGKAPQWMVFPWAWRRWTMDEEVIRSAAGYIVEHVPSARTDVEFAMERNSKSNQARAWRYVGDLVANALSRQRNVPIDLGNLNSHSHTAVRSMPMRIASRMGNYVSPEWVPPKPRPEFEHPERSGRILLANQFGIHPTKGPGVDESTITRQDEERNPFKPTRHRRGQGSFQRECY